MMRFLKSSRDKDNIFAGVGHMEGQEKGAGPVLSGQPLVIKARP